MKKNAQIVYKERNGIFVLYSVPRNLSMQAGNMFIS